MTKKEFLETIGYIIEQYDNERAAHNSGMAAFYKMNNREDDTRYPNFVPSDNLGYNIRSLSARVNDQFHLVYHFIFDDDCGRSTGKKASDVWDNIIDDYTREHWESVILSITGNFKVPENFPENDRLFFSDEMSARMSVHLADYIENHPDDEECRDLYVYWLETTSDSVQVIKGDGCETLVWIFSNRLMSVNTADFKTDWYEGQKHMASCNFSILDD